MIEGLDKQAPQIMIESKIVEIALDAEKTWVYPGVLFRDDEKTVLGRLVLEITLGGLFERQGLVRATLDALSWKANQYYQQISL